MWTLALADFDDDCGIGKPFGLFGVLEAARVKHQDKQKLSSNRLVSAVTKFTPSTYDSVDNGQLTRRLIG